MIVIGLDTSTATGGVSIVKGERLLGLHVLGVEEGHSVNLLPSVQGLMETLSIEPREVAGIAVTIGPGSFTGLRIGLAAAKGLAYAWGVRLRAVNTLLASAWSLRGTRLSVCAAIDARRDHFFCNFYDGEALARPDAAVEATAGERLSLDEIATRVRHLVEQGRDVCFVGEGAHTLFHRIYGRGERFGSSGSPNDIHGHNSPADDETSDGVERRGQAVLMPLGGGAVAAHVAHIGALEFARGRDDDLFDVVPNYLRRSEAERRCRPSKS